MSKSPITVKILTQWIVGSFALACRICGREMEPEESIHWDHIHAEVFDGPHVWGNLRPTHAACNLKKGVAEHKASAKVKRLINPKPSKRPMRSSGRKIPQPENPWNKSRGGNVKVLE